MPDDPTYAQARAAVAEVLPRLTTLVRGLAASPRSAVGHWTVPDTVCHVSHAVDLDTTALAGGPLPGIEPTPAGAAAWNSQMLGSDCERDLGLLADRIDVRGTAFLEQAPTGPAVAWIFGAQLAPSAVACHLLTELLLHGYDIAKATGAPWVIEPDHAALAITGGGVPIINACPDLWVRHRVVTTARARIELRLRGGHRLALALDQRLTAEWPPAGAADAYLATTPEQALLIFFGRRNPWTVAASGGAIVWGRHPWALLTLLRAITSP